MNKRIFTSESVTEGHPDKVCDQISDGVLDAILAKDPMARVACETLVTNGMVLVTGQISTECYVDISRIARDTLCRIGYNSPEAGFNGNTCAVLTAIDDQSGDIAMGVNSAYDDKTIGAGDQGMMFGFACDETKGLMPTPISYAHQLARHLSEIRKSGELSWLRPDGKTQVSVQYGEDGSVERIDTVVVSTQHSAEIAIDDVRRAVIEKVIRPTLPARLIDDNTRFFVNPTGRFVFGGPAADTGLTGRKIIVDTYGGRGAHGGGAFSGKDPSKVDRSAAYAARHIAKNAVAAGIADEMLVQVSYAIGKAEPVSFYVNTRGTSHVALSDGQIAQRLLSMFDMRPRAIEDRLKLRLPIYEETAAYGHMGREPKWVTKHFESRYDEPRDVNVELFTWEKLDRVDELKQAFGL